MSYSTLQQRPDLLNGQAPFDYARGFGSEDPPLSYSALRRRLTFA
jgi:hypothetical protein